MGQRVPERIEKDFRLEEKFSRQVRQILGLQLFKKDWKRDLKEASDFILVAQMTTVGVRIRRQRYFSRYAAQFTIRYERPSGVETEYSKIRRGYMTHFFYGFCNKEEKRLIFCRLLDMAVFREIDPVPIEKRWNKSRDSRLAAYQYAQFPSSLILWDEENPW